ncbi:hypothetical protein EDB80DRAFT_872526 [Ilyonectria destructans]|nr:hypothetical protein EDB80DRAFT_872526 [Ilyonectria destructans]
MDHLNGHASDVTSMEDRSDVENRDIYRDHSEPSESNGFPRPHSRLGFYQEQPEDDTRTNYMSHWMSNIFNRTESMSVSDSYLDFSRHFTEAVKRALHHQPGILAMVESSSKAQECLTNPYPANRELLRSFWSREHMQDIADAWVLSKHLSRTLEKLLIDMDNNRQVGAPDEPSETLLRRLLLLEILVPSMKKMAGVFYAPRETLGEI